MNEFSGRLDEQGKVLPVTACPACGTKLDSATMAASAERPGPGDFSVCIGCAEVLRYEPDMTLRKALAEELISELDLPSRRLVYSAQETIKEKIVQAGEVAQYNRQLETMLANKKAWLKSHPEADVKVQFNFPPKVCLVAPISQALKEGYVSTNEAGREIIQALWPWHSPRREPTVLMVRAVLECEQ